MDNYDLNLLPRVSDFIDELSAFVNWEGVNKERPIPVKGIIPAYDELVAERKSIKL